MRRPLSYEYIRGLVEGEGCFTFCSNRYRGSLIKIPTFALEMSVRDKDLIQQVKETLALRDKVYEFKPVARKDGYKRQAMCRIMVRDVGQLKNKIIPLFYGRLNGYKSIQFREWMEKIGSDHEVPERYKFLYIIYKKGFYEKNVLFDDHERCKSVNIEF